MSRSAIPIVLVALALVAGACLERNPSFDPSQSNASPDPPGAGGWGTDAGGPGVPPADDAGGPGDDDDAAPTTPLADAAAPALDVPPATPPPTTPPPPSSNVAPLCQQASQCGADELCVLMDANTSTGLCLRRCKKLDARCALSDPALFAGCAEYASPLLGSIRVCMLFCKLGKKSYPCPDKVNYRCKSYGGGIGVCVAR